MPPGGDIYELSCRMDLVGAMVISGFSLALAILVTLLFALYWWLAPGVSRTAIDGYMLVFFTTMIGHIWFWVYLVRGLQAATDIVLVLLAVDLVLLAAVIAMVRRYYRRLQSVQQ